MNEFAIKDFGDYTMDIDSGRVFSYRQGGRKELKVQTNSRGRKIVELWENGKRYTFGYTRLWYCVIQSISLREIPKDLCVTTGEDGKPRLIDEAERARLSVRRRAENIRRFRIRNMERKMMELQMMMEYYKTNDFTPIAAYAESLRENMIMWFCRYHGSGRPKGEESFEVACSRLESRVRNPHSQICDILLLLKHEMMNVYKERVRTSKMEAEAAYESILKKTSERNPFHSTNQTNKQSNYGISD